MRQGSKPDLQPVELTDGVMTSSDSQFMQIANKNQFQEVMKLVNEYYNYDNPESDIKGVSVKNMGIKAI